MSFKTKEQLANEAEEARLDKKEAQLIALGEILDIQEEENLTSLLASWNQRTYEEKCHALICFLGAKSLESPLKYPSALLGRPDFDEAFLKFEQETKRVLNAHELFTGHELSDKLFDYAKRLATKLVNELVDGSRAIEDIDFFPDWSSKANVPIDFVYLTFLAELSTMYGNDVEMMVDFVEHLTKEELKGLDYGKRLRGDLKTCETLLELVHGRPVKRPSSQCVL